MRGDNMSKCPWCKQYKPDVIYHYKGYTVCKECADRDFQKELNKKVVIKSDFVKLICDRCKRSVIKLLKIKIRKKGIIHNERVCRDCKRKIRANWLKLIEERSKK